MKEKGVRLDHLVVQEDAVRAHLANPFIELNKDLKRGLCCF